MRQYSDLAIDLAIDKMAEIFNKKSTPLKTSSVLLQAIEIIRQLRREAASPPNPPLTLEELREMDGEPVWCQAESRPGAEGWFLVDASALQPHDFIAVGKERGIPCAGIETGYWLAYRRKPDGGEE